MSITLNTSTAGGNSKDNENDEKVQAVSVVVLNDYEKLRAKNIERNNAKLRAFGLISAKEEKQSNDRAWKRAVEDEDAVGGEKDEDEYNPENDDDDEAEDWVDIRRPLGGTMKRKRKKKTDTTPSGDETSSSPSRKSLRLQGKAPNGNIEVRKKQSKEQLYHERVAMVQECREARQRAAVEVAKAGQKIAAKENPTATYEHCLMRVKTMTDKKLLNRIKVIERAAGKHCVVKMAIFKSCLQDEEQWDLANLANEALERLKALQPPPLST